MKKIIALVLVLCMTFGMIVSASAASPFAKRLNLVRLIRTMFGSNNADYGIGELDGSELTIYVAVNGKADADGTKNNPYATIEDARDAIRGINKSGLNGITVIIGSGVYEVSETILFTEEDAGTEKCPITYRGEDGAIFNGGTAFDYSEFKKAEGDTLALFPEEVQDKLYMLDLSKFGYTPEDIAAMKAKGKYYNEAGIILVNGKQMDLARYPNADEGWIEIEGGHFLDANGEYTEYTDNDKVDKELQAHQTIIEYGEEHTERVLSWNCENLFVRGHYRFIWARDDTRVIELFTDRAQFLAPYSGGYAPVENGLLFFYNISEELDVPGEFYIDDNAILYYYPEEDFETSHFTLPLLDASLMDITGADYLTFDNLTFESSLKNGITFDADNLTFDGCTVRGMYEDGVEGTGVNIKFVNNEIAYVGRYGIMISGGDAETLTRSNNLICNNYIHNWSTRTTMAFGLNSKGCGATVCHNEVANSTDLGIEADGPLHTVEYNYVHDTCQFFCDGATVSVHGYAYGTVVRYNAVMNTGFESPLDIVGVQSFTADMDSPGADFYGNISYNCTGHGLSLAYSRDSQVTNNLVIKAGRSMFQAISPTFNEDIVNGVVKERKVKDYLLSDIWQSSFPELQGIHGKYDPDNYADPMYILAPANNVVKNNYYFNDKGYSTWLDSQQHKLGVLTDIEGSYYELSEIEEISAANNNLSTYNSRRNSNPITIAEALAIANEAVGTVMTEEQLNEVGRIGVEHNIGDIIVE